MKPKIQKRHPDEKRIRSPKGYKRLRGQNMGALIEDAKSFKRTLEADAFEQAVMGN